MKLLMGSCIRNTYDYLMVLPIGKETINTFRWCEVIVGKVKTSIALDEDYLKWIDGQIRTKRFASRSHAMEYALEKLKNEK
jgi:hypothetical protein